MSRILKIGGIGCGGLIGLIILIAILVAVFGGKSKPSTAPPTTTTAAPSIPANEAAARSYIRDHGGDSYRVQANLLNVQLAVGEAVRSATQTNIYKLAQTAQTAHDNLDAIRSNFTYSDSGRLGDAEGNVLLAANDLKNSMGSLVTYTGTPNPATLAQFSTQYANARAEWNSGVKTIWRIAHRKHPPTV